MNTHRCRCPYTLQTPCRGAFGLLVMELKENWRVRLARSVGVPTSVARFRKLCWPPSPAFDRPTPKSFAAFANRQQQHGTHCSSASCEAPHHTPNDLINQAPTHGIAHDSRCCYRNGANTLSATWEVPPTNKAQGAIVPKPCMQCAPTNQGIIAH